MVVRIAVLERDATRHARSAGLDAYGKWGRSRPRWPLPMRWLGPAGLFEKAGTWPRLSPKNQEQPDVFLALQICGSGGFCFLSLRSDSAVDSVKERGLKLRDMADRLDLTSAFVSAIETGRKPIPRGYMTTIAEAFELTEAEETELERAADKTRTTVHVDNLAAHDRRLVASFARRVKQLPPDVLESLSKLKNHSGRSGVLVPPRSRAAIQELADKFVMRFSMAKMTS